MEQTDCGRILILEPFYGGSHKQLIDVIIQSLEKESYDLFTLPAKKWHWKARCSALQFLQVIPEKSKYKTLFCSSVLNLSELLGIRPDLCNCHKVVYFHENQLVYPVQRSESGDFQFGYNQILTALSADKICFNSKYNFDSFMSNIGRFLKLIPGYSPKNLLEKIKPKCEVLYFPVNFSDIRFHQGKPHPTNKVLHIVWAHRWEHDKDPKSFFDVLLELQENGFNFRLSVLGQVFTETPDVFTESKNKLTESCIANWGFVESKSEYYAILQSADVTVSTAIHEFFGVSMMESTYCGCLPLCPNRLSYPELYPPNCLYNTNRQLYKRLREYCIKPWLPAEQCKNLNIDFESYSWKKRKADYFNALRIDMQVEKY